MIGNLGPETRALVIALIVGAAMTLGIRFYVRSRLVRRFGWEDGFMLLAFGAQLMFAICIIGAVHYGAGRHIKDIPPKNQSRTLKWLWASQIGYGIGIIAARLSIGFVLLRFLVQRVQKWIVYVTLAFSVVFGILVLFLGLFECKPVDLFWNPAKTRSCDTSQPLVVISVIGSIVAVLCDFSLAIVPMVLVWGLNLSRMTKIALLPIFGLACCASVGAVVEIFYLVKVDTKDFTYGIMNVVIWCHVELGLAIMAGNLVTIRPLYRKIVSKFGFQAPTNFFRVRTPRWTSFFTRNDEQNDNGAGRRNMFGRSTRRQTAHHETGESHTLVDSKSRERLETSDRIDNVPNQRVQDDRITTIEMRPTSA